MDLGGTVDRETLTDKQARELVAYVRLAVLTLPRELELPELLVELEREAIVLLNGATLIGDPEGEAPRSAGQDMGALLYSAQDYDPEWEALVSNALRAHRTGELPVRWTVGP